MPNPRSRHALAIALCAGFGAASLAQQSNNNPSTESEDEEVFELSPFVVTKSENDIGYRQQNTLAGSRLNMNLSDVAASITTVTLQQIEDTASLDLNDIFKYEAGTEGSSTYTPNVSSLRNDGVVDTIAGFTHGGDGQPQTNAGANRVRGLGSPDASINFYRAIRQVPLDPYNVQSIDISRGPNSMLFGIGSPAGFVNQNRSSAALDHTAFGVKFRVDNYGSVRGSASFNLPLIDEKLAIFGAVLRDDKAFARKPSFDITERIYTTLTFKPFEGTRIKASFEDYDNRNRRPNNLTPRDFVSEWRDAGRPVYDPATMMVTIQDSGKTVGPFVGRNDSPYINDVRAYIESLPNFNASGWNAAKTTYNGVPITGGQALTNPNSIMYVPGIGIANGRPTMQIADGQVVNWFQAQPGQYRAVFGTSSNPAANAPLVPSIASIQADLDTAAAFNQFWTYGNAWSGPTSTVGSYRYGGVTDKSIYDYSSVNILQMNFGKDANRSYNLEFEQKIRDDLFFNAGWFRQNFDSYTSYTVSQLNVATLFVDTNKTLPDGSPNPYFGQPYVEDFDPDRFVNRIDNNQYRASLAYTPDFTKSDGWTRWLGRHQFLAFGSREEEQRDFIRQRLNFIDGQEDENGTIRFLANPNNDASGNPTGWRNEGGSTRRAFYLGSAFGDPTGAVTMTSGEWNPVTYTGPLTAYNFGNETWEDISMTHQFKDHSASTNRAKTHIISKNLGGTSYFWDDRVVATWGVRHDKAYNTLSSNGRIVDEDGEELYPAMTNPEKWVDGYYQTDAVFERFQPWGMEEQTTRTRGVVARPLKDLGFVDKDSILGEFLNDFGISYNWSETFNPPTTRNIDIFGNPLPKPAGVGEDFGIQFSMFDRKLFARLNFFYSTIENERVNGGTPISRMNGQWDTDTFRAWARTIALINSGEDPTAEGFGADLTPAEEDAIQAATSQIWGLPYNYYGELPGSVSATRSAAAEGAEFQLTYNPTKNWNIKWTAAKTTTRYSNVLKEFDAWFDHRNPVWTAAKASDYLLPQYQSLAKYTTAGGAEVDLSNFLTSYGYVTQIRLGDSDPVNSAQEYYNAIVTPQVAFAKDSDGQIVRGQSRYTTSVITNYKFSGDRLKGLAIGGNLRWKDRAVVGYYGKSSGITPGLLDIADISRPIYSDDKIYTEIWASYQKDLDDQVRMKVQFNIQNLFEDGGLEAVGFNYDGSPNAYRILDPRQYVLSVSFDM